MAINAVACSRCGGQASLTEHNVRLGWACPHCGQSHWPAAGGWAAAPTAPRDQPVASRIHPTRAATPGWTATVDLVTKPFGLHASPVARIASIALAGSAVAVAIAVARSALG
ncbi:MAG TPA: hypothetical protein VGB64_05615 [Actinomycetota bacterium]